MMGIICEAMFMPVSATCLVYTCRIRFAPAAPVWGLQSREHRWTSPRLIGRVDLLV